MPIGDQGEKLDENEQLEKLRRWVSDWSDATVDARAASERDRDYYDGIQWTTEEIETLEERGQPVITINRVAPKINAVLGHEIRVRTDPEALPRTPQHQDEAPAITDALRYVRDKEDFDGLKSDVTNEVCIEGLGGCIVHYEQEGDDVEIKLTQVPWDRFIYDPHSRRRDLTDAEYMGIVTWSSVSEAIAEYGDENADILRETLDSGTDVMGDGDTTEDRPTFIWKDRAHKRVRIVEMYYKHKRDWYVTHFVRSGILLEPEVVGYRDDKGRTVCPMAMTSAFITRENERYGLVRHMISPQDEINKRRSKALHLLSVRQIAFEEGAFLHPDKARDELAKPDGMIEFTPGALSDGRFQQLATGDMVAQQFQLLQEAKQEIDDVGPSAQTLLDQATSSGREFIQRQKAATLGLEPFFDGLRDWERRVCERIWWGIRQVWPQERWFRVRDDQSNLGYRFVALNRRMSRLERVQDLIENGSTLDDAINQVGVYGAAQIVSQVKQQIDQQQQMAAQAQPQGAQGEQAPPEPVPEEQINQAVFAELMKMPEMREEFTANDVASLDVDIVLSEAPDTAVVEEEEFEKLTQMASTGAVPIPPDVLIEASQLRSKRKLLEMLEQQNQPNPMADQQAQMQMQMLQAQMGTLQAQGELDRARIAEVQAKAAKLMAEAQQGVAAEARKDLAIAARHEAEAGGEYQSQRIKDESSLGGPGVLALPQE